MRRRLTLTTHIVGMAVLAACGGEPEPVDAGELQREVDSHIASMVGVTPQSVDCPDDLAAEASARTTCTWSESNGGSHEVQVEVTDIEGGEITYEIYPIALDTSELENRLIKMLDRDVRRGVESRDLAVLDAAPQSVECDGWLALELQDARLCAVTTSAGTRYGLTAIATAIDGTSVTVEYRIDVRRLN